MKRYEAEYEKWRAEKHYCKCGCGKELSITYRTFVYHLEKGGMPEYYSYHYITKKYINEYQEWLGSNPKCQCGCNQAMTSSYQSFCDSMYRTGQPPKFKSHHGHRKWGKTVITSSNVIHKTPPKIDYISFNGCRIIPTKKEQRCDNFKECSHYLDCLEFVIVENKALGWKLA